MAPLQQNPAPSGRQGKRRRYLWIGGICAAGVVGLAALVLVLVLTLGHWRAYTDGIEVYQRAGETVVRNVVWQDPKRLAGSVNLDVDTYEPTMSGDGRTMVFTRWRASKNADLFVTHWDGDQWSTPAPLEELNTPVAELGPEISRDGKYLYFYSNRSGGLGGYDLWVSRRLADRWSAPVNLGPQVNSEFNEYGPGLSPDGGILYFSSNRPKRKLTEAEQKRWRATLREEDLATDYDIYAADVFFDRAAPKETPQPPVEARPATQPTTRAGPVMAAATQPSQPAPPPWPKFARARAVHELNSRGYDGQVAFTPRGDFLYFSSNRKGGRGGFDVYRSRLFRGEFLPPENVGPPVNTYANEMDPTLSVHGYWLVFSSNRDQDDPRHYLLYETITREVMAVSDFAGLYAVLALLDLIKWWILAVLVGAAVLAYLLYLIFGAKSRQRSLLATCMLLSLLAHAAMLTLMGIWMITLELKRATGFDVMEISVDADALASEKLALEIREQVTDLEMAPDAMTPGEQVHLPPQELEPITTPPAASLEAAFRIDPADLEVDVRPMEVRTPEELAQAAEVKNVQPLAFAVAEMMLETRRPQQKPVEQPSEEPLPDPVRAERLTRAQPRPAPAVDKPQRPAAAAEASIREDAGFQAPEVDRPQKVEPAAQVEVRPVKLQDLALPVGKVAFEAAPKPRPPGADAAQGAPKDIGRIATMAPAPGGKPAPQEKPATAVTGLAAAQLGQAAEAPQVPRPAAEEAPSPAGTEPSPAAVESLTLRTTDTRFETAPVKSRPKAGDALEAAPQDVGRIAAMAAQALQPAAPRRQPADAVSGAPAQAAAPTAAAAPKPTRPGTPESVRGPEASPMEVPKLALRAEEPAFETGPKSREKGADADQPPADIARVASRAGEAAAPSQPQKELAVPVSASLPEIAVQVVRVPGKTKETWRSAEAGQLAGTGPAVVRQVPKLEIRGPSEVEAREARISPHLLRDKKLREGLIKGLGGSKKTEAAVARALNWFTLHQEPDGRWSCQKHGGQAGHDTGATGFAMLCYYGWGAKHTQKGPHQEPLAKAVQWMLKHVKPNGDLTAGASNGMYDQGIATMALAEAYALTKDPALEEPLKKAVAFILKAQSKQHGGWRYRPNSRDGDTSVFGWQVMALASARMAGLEVPEASWKLSGHWLNRVGGGKHGGLYGYANKSPKPAMVAEGMFSQQLLGTPREHPRMAESAAYLKTAPPAARQKQFYYWYYGCLSLYQHRGPIWEGWNEKMKQVLLQSQVTKGEHAGSWAPQGVYGKQSGRVVTTAMATLCLEVYYRFLPMYRSMQTPADAEEKSPPAAKAKPRKKRR